MDRRIVGAIQRIDNLSAKAKVDPVSADDELKAQLAQFLCVLTSGLLEESVRATLTRFSETGSKPPVARYVAAKLGGFQNPKFEKIMSMLDSFVPKWRLQFENPESAETKAAINSIVNSRNQIAHGREVGVSLVNFDRYFVLVKRFIASLDALVSS